MFRVGREIYFSYGHRLLNHPGKCANLHGHNARVVLEISSQMLNPEGMVLDFYKIRETVGEWINQTLDHKMILCENDPYVKMLQAAGEPLVLMKENPTAEVLAKWIFDQARHMRLGVSRVTLWETENSFAVYHE